MLGEHKRSRHSSLETSYAPPRRVRMMAGEKRIDDFGDSVGDPALIAIEAPARKPGMARSAGHL